MQIENERFCIHRVMMNMKIKRIAHIDQIGPLAEGGNAGTYRLNIHKYTMIILVRLLLLVLIKFAIFYI